ncbi:MULTISPECIES: AEC family transporter [Vibrio]|uniref:AEC family transporter n=1 Tax=Vibrio casei TaxID=673372 RepID=A0A368LIC8_9VIBR|nr:MULTISPECIES: AEC family transporter [Vibrio]RCS70502.1 AEC family transporter [Vibrio casei]SJN27961.1 Transporter [Vibrio casei]HBV77905.1 AEC family transporter [Vibrio sp.]
MSGILEQFSFSVSITGPICLMLLLGILLRRWKLINDNFIEIASKLVFQVTLPALLFLSIIKSNTITSDSIPLVAFGVIANTLFFLFASITTKIIIKHPAQQGVIIQGAFRSNTAIIGLAYVANAYGESGVALAAVYVAAVTVLYNILAVIALTPKSDNSNIKAYGIMMKSITKNPLIIAIVLALIVYELTIPVPEVIIHAGQYFADMTLPLALLCTGGSLDTRQLKHDKAANILASGYKLLLCPLFITLGAYWYGFTGMQLGLVFFMTASPAAAASYVMARAMGGDATLAANIIALTTVGSILTCSLGIMLLSTLNLM